MSAVLHPVQTSGPDADLFGGPPPAPAAAKPHQADCALQFTGRLARKPHVAMKPTGDGHFVPALVLNLDDVGAGHHAVEAHVVYGRDERAQADAAAARLHRGEWVTVTNPLTDIRLLLPAASFSTDTP